MTKKKIENSADNDNQEIYTGFYGSMVNPRYASTVINVDSAVLTADMLTRAAEKARTIYYPSAPTGLMSAHALRLYEGLLEEKRLKDKFHSSPVGELLK